MKKVIVIVSTILILASLILLGLPAFAQTPQEVIALRTENTKTFDLGNGRYSLEISGSAIHYKDNYSDPNEQWKDIDPTIVNGKVTKTPYELTIDYANLSITFRDKRTNLTTVLTLIGIPPGQLKKVTPSILGNEATFAEVLSGLDLRIVAGNNGVSFQRVVKDASVSKKASFSVSGDTSKLKSNAYDNNDKSIKVSSSLTANSLYEDIQDTDLIGVVYPITIDPTVTIQPSSKDNYLAESLPTYNGGTITYLATEAYTSGKIDRALVEFPVVWGTDIPAGATITLAQLKLYYYSYESSGAYINPVGRTIYAYRLLRLDWNETQSTWNIYKTGSNWTTAGAGSNGNDHTTTNGASTTVPASYGWMAWDITAQVQTAQTGSVNVACLLKDSSEVETSGYLPYWYSNNEATQTTLRPILYIEYTAPFIVTSSAATDIATTTATWNGNITSTGGVNCDYRGFVWDTVSRADPGDVAPASSGYAVVWTQFGSYGTGTFTHDVTGLTAGTTWYFRACAYNTYGWDYSNTEQTVYTKPEAPTGLAAVAINSTRIDLTWTNGTGAEKTMVRGKTASYPTGVGDGYQVYYDTLALASDTTVSEGITYYYRAWAWDTNSGYSDGYSYASATTPLLGLKVVLLYQPNSMVDPNNLVDNSGSGNTGTIHWGTNPGGIEVTVGELAPYASYVPPSGGAPSPTQVFTPPTGISPGTAPTEESVSGMFMYDSFHRASQSLGFPNTSILYGTMFFIVGIVLGVGVLAATGSLLGGALMANATLALGIPNVWAWWVPALILAFIIFATYISGR